MNTHVAESPNSDRPPAGPVSEASEVKYHARLVSMLSGIAAVIGAVVFMLILIPDTVGASRLAIIEVSSGFFSLAIVGAFMAQLLHIRSALERR